MSGIRRMLPSANALFVFEAAARHQSFSRAASDLNVTQPAVSRMVSRLEQHLGTSLFLRGASGASLTAEGATLYRAITRGFGGIEGALREIAARQQSADTITLSLSSAFTTHWLMPRIDFFRRAFPDIDLRFQLIAGALQGPVGVDLGMRFLSPGEEGYTPALSIAETMIPVCSPSYLEARRAGGGDTVINLTDSHPRWVEDFPELEPAAMLQFPDYAVVIQATLLGQGIGLGWTYVVSHWLRTGQLVPAASGMMRTNRRCHLLPGEASRQRPMVLAVRDWILGEIRAELAAVIRRYPALEGADAV